MQPRGRAAFFPRPARVRALLLAMLAMLFLVAGARAASLQTFIVVFGQLTNEIAEIQADFENSPQEKERLGLLTRARSVILNEEFRDEQALVRLIPLLGNEDDYEDTLDEAASNARATVLARYHLIGTRVSDLPPSRRATLARDRFNNLADERTALANAQHAEGISNLLAPFGSRVESVARLAARARIMPRPSLGLDAVRATVDGRRFSSTANGRNSPNIFEVTAPTSFYRAVDCRAVDGVRVIHFHLPVVTEQVRYEVAQGLATISYTPDIFATNAQTMTATSGTFFVQSDRNEVYGVFSCAGPGFEIKDGRFRIELPRALRGK
jgi:hypothetical protein